MKRVICALLIISIVMGNISILPAFAADECVSLNKTVTARGNAAFEVGVPGGLTDGKTNTVDSSMYYQWSYAPWFCIDLGGFYEISGIRWLTRYSSTTDELEADIYGAKMADWSDKEIICSTQAANVVEYTVSEGERNVYRYIIVQKPGKGCGIGGKEFYVYGRDVSADYAEDKAYDGDFNTYWMSSGEENNLQLDLGEEKVINAVELSARHDTDNPAERTNFELWFSNDSEFNNYVVVPCVSSVTNTERKRVGKPYDFKATYKKETDLPDKYRYVRYVKFSGISSVSEINVITSDEDEEIADTGILQNFEIKTEFVDAAGDVSEIFVPRSPVEFRGEIKNNTQIEKKLYAVVASYSDEGVLRSIDIDEVRLSGGEFGQFSCRINADVGSLRGFLFENNMRPVCKARTAKKYTGSENAVYVSEENGDDNNDGSVLLPFKTVERAIEAADEIKGNGDVYIRIKNGYYSVNKPVVLKSGNSGNANGYIVYEGFGNDETVISAGKKISGFSKGADGIYFAGVSGIESIKDLYINGERRNIASSEIITATDEVYDTEKKLYGPVVLKNQLPENIKFVPGMEIYYPSVSWRSYSLKLDNITDNEGSCIFNVTESVPVKDRNTYNLLAKFDSRAFRLRNSLQLLNEPGEWYHDKENTLLYYMPFEGEDMSATEAVVSGIDNIFNISDAEYIKFKGLTFAHTGWADALEKGELRWQGHQLVLPVEYASPPAAVFVKYSHNIDIDSCVFKNTGAVGVALEWGVKNCNITGNVFYDIADSAMYLGNYRDIEKTDKTEYDLVENINVRNNVITNTNVEYHTSPALQYYSVKNVNIENNDISDCPYSAISAGPLVWTNKLADSDETHTPGMYGYNRICNNTIHEVNKLNTDGGAIYTLGHNHGTVISGNYIKNQYMDYGAIYNDEGSACFEIHSNVAENVPGWLYEWTEQIYFIKAYNNYATTDENYGGFFCEKSEIEDVNIFSEHDDYEAIKQIISNAGLESEYMQKLGKYITQAPDKASPVFGDNVEITAQAGERILLTANFVANDSGRYRWKAVGSNKSNVTFKDGLHGWLKTGRQFEKIYADFSKPGVYEIICESDDGRGYIYADRQYVNVY